MLANRNCWWVGCGLCGKKKKDAQVLTWAPEKLSCTWFLCFSGRILVTIKCSNKRENAALKLCQVPSSAAGGDLLLFVLRFETFSSSTLPGGARLGWTTVKQIAVNYEEEYNYLTVILNCPFKSLTLFPAVLSAYLRFKLLSHHNGQRQYQYRQRQRKQRLDLEIISFGSYHSPLSLWCKWNHCKLFALWSVKYTMTGYCFQKR